MAGATLHCCKNTSPRMTSSRMAGIPVKVASPRPATKRPPGNWCKPGSTAARSVRLNARGDRRALLLRRPAIGLGAGTAHQHRPLGGAQAIRLQEGFDALLVIDDRKGARPVGAPQAALE